MRVNDTITKDSVGFDVYTPPGTGGGCGSSNIDLMSLYRESVFSDLELRVFDQVNERLACVVRTHRVILYAASGYFRGLLMTQPAITTLQISVDFAQLEQRDAVMQLFFRLFYVASFDDAELLARIDEQGLLQSHLLYFYQLASYYACDALRQYCERILFGAFSLDCFKLFSDYALTASVHTAGKFCILNERLLLYARFLQWYQCCTEQQQQEDEDYFLWHKTDIVEELRGAVENIDACRLPEMSVVATSATERHVEYYRRVCHHCLCGEQGADAAFTNIGCIKKHYRNGSETYAFRLWKQDRHHCVMQLAIEREIHGASNNGEIVDPTEWLFDSLSYYRGRSEIVLLSKRLALDRVHASFDEPVPTLETRDIGTFERHASQLCYRGRCQACQRDDRPIYVLIVRLDIEFGDDGQKSDSAPPTENADGVALDGLPM